MQTPVKVSLDQYLHARREFLAQKTVTSRVTGLLVCAECGLRIRAQAATLEVHGLDLGICEGQRDTMNTAVPYCPRCEEVPAVRGCVHRYLPEAILIPGGMPLEQV
jgi:hypothetical protein